MGKDGNGQIIYPWCPNWNWSWTLPTHSTLFKFTVLFLCVHFSLSVYIVLFVCVHCTLFVCILNSYCVCAYYDTLLYLYTHCALFVSRLYVYLMYVWSMVWQSTSWYPIVPTQMIKITFKHNSSFTQYFFVGKKLLWKIWLLYSIYFVVVT